MGLRHPQWPQTRLIVKIRKGPYSGVTGWGESPVPLIASTPCRVFMRDAVGRGGPFGYDAQRLSSASPTGTPLLARDTIPPTTAPGCSLWPERQWKDGDCGTPSGKDHRAIVCGGSGVGAGA